MQIRKRDSSRLLVPLAAFALFLGSRCLVAQETLPIFHSNMSLQTSRGPDFWASS
jgi:hypothetical protein